MAMILYKYYVDTEAYENYTGRSLSPAVHTKYRDPLYSTNIYPISIIRARYGEDYVDVWETEIDVKWKPINWEALA